MNDRVPCDGAGGWRAPLRRLASEEAGLAAPASLDQYAVLSRDPPRNTMSVDVRHARPAAICPL